MKNCPECMKKGNVHKRYLEYARIESGVWVYFKKCEICGAEFDTELGKEIKKENPFEEGKDG